MIGRLFQWEVPWGLYVLYRLAVAALFLVWIVADFFDEATAFYSDNYALWLIFATNWSFLLLGVTSVYQATVTTMYYIQERNLQSPAGSIDEEAAKESDHRHGKTLSESDRYFSNDVPTDVPTYSHSF